MNAREKEAYLRDYSVMKSQGKPFFPYAVAKDSIMALIVMIVIITLSIALTNFWSCSVTTLVEFALLEHVEQIVR